MIWLHRAASSGDVEEVTRLLDSGADANGMPNPGGTPLFLACQNGHDEVARLLIDSGTDLNRTDFNGTTPLHIACQRATHEVTAMPIDEDGNVLELRFASGHGYIAIGQLLVERGADLNRADRMGRTALHAAIRNDHLTLARLLAERGADLNCADKYGRTPFYTACEKGHDSIVETLVAHGADTTTIVGDEGDGFTALHIACLHGHLPLAQLLLEAGADLDRPDRRGRTPLQTSFDSFQYYATALLLERGAALGALRGETVLRQACIIGNEPLARAITERGVDVDEPDEDGLTPLLTVCSRDHASLVQVLFEKGADRQAFCY